MIRRNTLTGRRGRIESLEPRRLLAIPGSLDPSFSGDGKATFANSGLFATDVAVQADGKTVVVGTAPHVVSFDPNGVQFAVARFNVDGTPDSTFSFDGIVFTQLSDAFRHESRAEAVAIAPDGKIVVVGSVQTRSDSGNEKEKLAVARYNPDGTLDNTFDDNGVLSMDLSTFSTIGTHPTRAFDVVVQGDGKIVIVGETVRDFDDDFFVVRLLDNGAKDPFFGSLVTINEFGTIRSGVRFVGFGNDDAAVAVKLDNAGGIVVTGHADNDANPGDADFQRRVGVVRLTPAGDLLDPFGGDGKIDFQLPTHLVTQVADVMIQGDGKVVIAGHAKYSNSQNHFFFVARFTNAGVLDPTFGGSNGFTVTDVGGDGVVGGITPTPIGAGGGFIVSGGSSGMAAVKYTDNGLVDTTFGSGGKVRLLFGGVASVASWFGRRIVLAGGSGFATARLLLADARKVTAGVFDSLAIEGTTNTGIFVVGRTEKVPFPTRIFFSISGTATISNTRTGSRDYSMPGLAISSVFTPTSGSGFVDIPANQSSVILTFSTVNDTLREVTESATFTILSSSTYEISSPVGGTISIRDDDTSFSLGTTTVAKPPKHVGVGQELQAAVTWTVPTGGWRDLSSIELRLRNWHDDDALAILTFDEATNSFSVESTPGADNPVSLILSKCTFQAAGPDAPTVTVIFTFVFNPSAANTRFRLDVGATNDSGDFSGFEQIGELHVHKKPKGDTLALPL